MYNIQQAFGLHVSQEFVKPVYQLAGIECEIEGVLDFTQDIHDVFSVTEDGSLRNNGREFISVPGTKAEIVREFEFLHANLTCKEGQKFSERTSIHVHMNCCNLLEEEVRNIVLMYALYEEFFFLLAEPSRKHNIHCVPLTETYLPSIYRMSLRSMAERWHKYTALNLCPLRKLGTIEFRHLEGHDDPKRMQEWLDVLWSLFEVGKKNPINSETLTSDNLDKWFMEIFGSSSVAPLRMSVPDLTYNQRLDVKLAFV